VFERAISTRVFPAAANVTYGPDGADPQETYISMGHPLFHWALAQPADEWTYPLHGRAPFLDITVCDATDEMLVKGGKKTGSGNMLAVTLPARFNGKTGAFLGVMTGFTFDLATCGCWPWFGHPVYSWDGSHIYYSEGTETEVDGGYMFRFTRDGQAAPWPGTGSYMVTGLDAPDQSTRGHCPGPDNSLYVLHYAKELDKQCYSSAMGVSKIVDGRVVKRNIVLIYSGVTDLQVDLKGNIYIAAKIKPKDSLVPGFIEEDSLAGSYDRTWAGGGFTDTITQKFWAKLAYGSILKFDSTGGSVVLTGAGCTPNALDPASDTLMGGSGGQETYAARARGLKWMYYGYSHVLSHGSRGSLCWCHSTRFDMDRFGRIFFPNTFQHEMTAIDANRNLVFRLKNRDVSAAAIGLGHHIEVTDRALYVADHYNNQVVSFTLEADAEETVALPPSIQNEASLMRLPGGAVLCVWPNPVTGHARISAGVAGPVKITICDVQGKTAGRFSGMGRGPGGFSVTWTPERLPSGIYILSLILDGKTYRKPVMVVR
jgi:hypothetical protein